jgi:hypothetical protein
MAVAAKDKRCVLLTRRRQLLTLCVDEVRINERNISIENWCDDTDREYLNVMGGKTCASAILYAINPTGSGLGSKPELLLR